ncbi:exo-rhamnogalacturonan lyase family protein [Streptomyces mexicanus]|uniref:exo-rhamnogalacturonan lyase family protein n=1 Tax=Streptomyces mexicanus TaxID=178566 RepID=UPI003649D8C2
MRPGRGRPVRRPLRPLAAPAAGPSPRRFAPPVRRCFPARPAALALPLPAHRPHPWRPLDARALPVEPPEPPEPPELPHRRLGGHGRDGGRPGGPGGRGRAARRGVGGRGRGRRPALAGRSARGHHRRGLGRAVAPRQGREGHRLRAAFRRRRGPAGAVVAAGVLAGRLAQVERARGGFGRARRDAPPRARHSGRATAAGERHPVRWRTAAGQRCGGRPDRPQRPGGRPLDQPGRPRHGARRPPGAPPAGRAGGRRRSPADLLDGRGGVGEGHAVRAGARGGGAVRPLPARRRRPARPRRPHPAALDPAGVPRCGRRLDPPGPPLHLGRRSAPRLRPRARHGVPRPDVRRGARPAHPFRHRLRRGVGRAGTGADRSAPRPGRSGAHRAGRGHRDGYRQLAVWNDFTLFQGAPDHFSVWKRTSASGSWLKHAGHGDRASGFAYCGGADGGLGFGLRDFWQRFPRALDVRDAGGETATVTLWSWSPLGGAMDLRPYDAEAHGLDLAYEDVQEGFGVPEGMVRSTEMVLWALAATPSRDTVTALSTTLTAPPQIVAAPAHYHGAGVFGRWSLPDRSTKARAALEDSLAADVAFYREQVDQRQWYGFWHYGDVMHTYDADRHTWRYDVGGYAWDNAELGTDAFLWYAFLRSGDPGAFRLARAMTQHVAEADTHHTGRFAGLGSRHNVVHWGDGAKEARVGESFTKRFSYYLTADDLLGDLIRTSLQADRTLLDVDPLREVLPPQTAAPARIRIGPDWYALVGNWLTEWERTGDTVWRDRIVTGMKDIAGFPAGLYTGEAGGAVGFDPRTGHLTNFGKGDFQGGYNLAMAFLGEQILWEVLDLVDVPEFRRTYLDFARTVQAPAAEKTAVYGRDFDPQVFKTIYSRVTAWAGEQLDEPALRRRGWQQFLSDPAGRPWPAAAKVSGNAVPEPVTEIPGGCATNDAAQRNLAIIALLAVAPDEAP